ncbi:hypothetical protein MMC29_000764 [Sticta canariensis]|nr:hypothetical protein [Sticta canariensis]
MSSVGRIPETLMRGIAGALSGVAFFAAICRIIIQLKKRRPLSIDDAFFAFSLVCLCASTTLLYQLIPGLYFEQKLVLDPSAVPFKTVIETIPELLGLQKISYAHLTLTWSVIFSVKFSFLFFFRLLIRRLATLDFYWRIVVWINAVGYILCVSEIFITCPHITLAGLRCWMDPHNLKPFIFTAIVISLDILTDVLIITIPVHLLWAIRIKLSQKLRLGLSLCLGIFMIMAALVKVSSLRSSHGNFDMVWILFWHHAEGCIAVLMVSFTAFRSLSVSQNVSSPRPNILPSWSSKLRLRKARSDQDLQWTGLPSIPPATLTGMRTYIGRSSGSPLEVEESPSAHNHHINVTRGFSVASDYV